MVTLIVAVPLSAAQPRLRRLPGVALALLAVVLVNLLPSRHR